MIAIQDLADKIKEELNDACNYIDDALDIMHSDKETANLYAELSAEEMTHVNKLHIRVESLIAAYRKEKGEPPQEMLWRYNYLHKEHMDMALKIKVKQQVYKEESK